MLKVPLEMPVPAAVPSVQIIRAVLREYHAATHTAQVEPVLGPASLVGEIPVLMSCRPDLLTTGREVAVLTWSDVGGLVLGPHGAVPDDPPNAGDADTVDGIHAATTPTASKLLAMDANGKFPAHTVEGTLKTDDDVRAGRGIYAGSTATDPGDDNIVADGIIHAKGFRRESTHYQSLCGAKNIGDDVATGIFYVRGDSVYHNGSSGTLIVTLNLTNNTLSGYVSIAQQWILAVRFGYNVNPGVALTRIERADAGSQNPGYWDIDDTTNPVLSATVVQNGANSYILVKARANRTGSSGSGTVYCTWHTQLVFSCYDNNFANIYLEAA